MTTRNDTRKEQLPFNAWELGVMAAGIRLWYNQIRPTDGPLARSQAKKLADRLEAADPGPKPRRTRHGP